MKPISPDDTLRQFILYSIAPLPTAAVRLDRRYMREWLRYEAGDGRKYGKRFAEYESEKAERDKFYKRAIKTVVADLSRYRDWIPTNEDWIRLHVARSGSVPVNYRKRSQRPKAEAEHYRDQLVRKYLRESEREEGSACTVAEAAREAHDEIKELERTHKVPQGFLVEAVTIEKRYHARKKDRLDRQKAEVGKQAAAHRLRAAQFRQKAVGVPQNHAKTLRIAAAKWEQDAEKLEWMQKNWKDYTESPDFKEFYVPDRDDLPPSIQDAVDRRDAEDDFEARFSRVVDEHLKRFDKQ